MKIEVLYAKACNLYGDQGNVQILKKTLIDATFFETDLNETPKFVSTKVDLVIMGAMSEAMQIKVIERLLPYKNRLIEMIDAGVHFIITGNALDIFGETIIKEDKTEVKGLGLFPFSTKEDLMHRHNSLVLGRYNNMEIVGFKTQFAQMYPRTTMPYFLSMERGTGYHVGAKFEGIQRNRFYGTNCVGPLLVLNPFFTLAILKELGIKHPQLPYETALIAAYHKRISEFRDPKIINHP